MNEEGSQVELDTAPTLRLASPVNVAIPKRPRLQRIQSLAQLAQRIVSYGHASYGHGHALPYNTPPWVSRERREGRK